VNVLPYFLLSYENNFHSPFLQIHWLPSIGYKVTYRNKPLRSREERTHNVVPIAPHDITSQAYHRENLARPEGGMGFVMTLVIWVLFLAIIFFIVDLLIGSWVRLK